jgi:hypothetical protein
MKIRMFVMLYQLILLQGYNTDCMYAISSMIIDQFLIFSDVTGVVDGGDEDDEFLRDDVDEDKVEDGHGMVETQMVRLVVRIFPVVHKDCKVMGRVISLIGLSGVNVAKCLQRVCDPRFYDSKHGDIGRAREALWRELVHSEFSVMEGEMRHDDMEGSLCDFDSIDDRVHHIFHFCSEVRVFPTSHPFSFCQGYTACLFCIIPPGTPHLTGDSISDRRKYTHRIARRRQFQQR